jgi:hypothetical protein
MRTEAIHSTRPLDERGFSAATLDVLAHASLDPVSFGSPAAAEQSLSPDLVTGYAIKSWYVWKERKLKNHETHPDLERSFYEVEAEREDWLRHLAVGKLSYYSAFITREGLEVMTALGRRGESLAVLEQEPLPSWLPHRVQPNAAFGESVRGTLARLHHENWLNANARGGYYHRCNHEWSEYAPEVAEEWRSVDLVQVDEDCKALAALAEQEPELYAALHRRCLPSVRDDEGWPRFFQEELALRVRNPNAPVVPLNPGSQCHEPLTPEQFTAVIELAAQGGPPVERFYDFHCILDELMVSAFEREVVRRLLYEPQDRAANSALRSTERIIANADCRRAVAQALCELVREGEITSALPLEWLVPMVEDRMRSRSDAALQETLKQAPVERAHSSFARAFPAFIPGASPAQDVRWQERWLDAHLPAFHQLTQGFPVGGPPGPERSSREALDHHTWCFRSGLSLAMLGIIQGFRPEAVDHLRALGQLMIQRGVRPVREAGFGPELGVALGDGSFARMNPELREELTREYRAAELDAELRTSAVLQTESRWKRSRMRASLDPEPHAATWREPYLNVYAFALALGMLSPSDYQRVRAGCWNT